MKQSSIWGSLLAAAAVMFLINVPANAQNYSPGDSVKWRGMGAQTQKGMEERERMLAEKKQAAKGAQKKQGSTSSKTTSTKKQTKTKP